MLSHSQNYISAGLLSENLQQQPTSHFLLAGILTEATVAPPPMQPCEVQPLTVMVNPCPLLL